MNGEFELQSAHASHYIRPIPTMTGDLEKSTKYWPYVVRWRRVLELKVPMHLSAYGVGESVWSATWAPKSPCSREHTVKGTSKSTKWNQLPHQPETK